jgi:uncharacterized repeat protein (TIGR01451 family)
MLIWAAKEPLTRTLTSRQTLLNDVVKPNPVESMNEIGKLARACRPRHNFQARQALALMVLLALVPSAVFLHGLRTQADAAPQVSPELEALMVTTQEKGSVRVIVGLDVGFRPEGDLAGIQDVLKQRQLIKTTQDAVLRRINLDLALAQLDEGLSIAKTVTLARNPAWRGDPITYTIEVAHSSGIAATGVRITDTLPMYVDGTDLDTTTTVPAGDSMTYEINATVANNAPYGSTITNTAYYSHASDNGQSSASINVSGETQYGYLPLVLNNHYVWDAYFEPNDRLSIAYGSLASGYTYLAYPDDMNDYYFFTLSAQATVSVSVDDYAPTSSYGTVALYGPVFGNERGQLVDYHGPRGDRTMTLGPHNLAPGKYHIQVYTTANRSTTKLYSLSVTY